MRRGALLLGLAAFAGCAAPRAAESVTPMIAISPGVAGRLALMDRYRLHDEDRKHMMERPRVWVEEAPDTSDTDVEETPAESEEAPTAAAAETPAEDSARPAH